MPPPGMPVEEPTAPGGRRFRWITLGTVKSGWYVLQGNWGVPGGFWVNWRGRTSIFQPCEFTTWEQVLLAAAWRCRQAGLRVVEFAPGRVLRARVARGHRLFQRSGA